MGNPIRESLCAIDSLVGRQCNATGETRFWWGPVIEGEVDQPGNLTKKIGFAIGSLPNGLMTNQFVFDTPENLKVFLRDILEYLESDAYAAIEFKEAVKNGDV